MQHGFNYCCLLTVWPVSTVKLQSIAMSSSWTPLLSQTESQAILKTLRGIQTLVIEWHLLLDNQLISALDLGQKVDMMERSGQYTDQVSWDSDRLSPDRNLSKRTLSIQFWIYFESTLRWRQHQLIAYRKTSSTKFYEKIQVAVLFIWYMLPYMRFWHIKVNTLKFLTTRSGQNCLLICRRKKNIIR